MKRQLAWSIVLLLLSAPVALADDDEDDEHDEDERDEERSLKIDVDGEKATVKLERDARGREDSVKVEFDAREAKIKVKHEEKNETVESEAKLEARFRRIVEFVDQDGDGAFDGNETVASSWNLAEDADDDDGNGSVDWGAVALDDAVSGNLTGKKLSARASFGPNATFGLDLYVYGAFALVGNASLAPTDTKIDIIVEHYPYVRDDTRIAVIVDLKAKEELKDDARGDDEDGVFSAVTEGNLSFRLTFTWLTTATVDGVDLPVHAAVLRNQEEIEDHEIKQVARVAIAYPRGDVIVHDPTIGVSSTEVSAASLVPMPGVVILVATLALGALAWRRR